MKVTPVRVKPRPRRTRIERLLMLAPEVSCRVTAQLFRLPPRLRRRALVLAIERGYAAIDRGDEEVAARLFYSPEVILRFAGDPVPGFLSQYEGRDAVFDVYARWQDEWGVHRRIPVGFVDRGDRIIVLLRELMRGESSGLEVENEVGQVFDVLAGRVATQTEYRSWDDALALA